MTMAPPGLASTQHFWVVTTFFNPLGWASRSANYRHFRRHIGSNLLTVEWSPTARFELGAGDADILVPVAGGDLLWQKERLLNVALEHLPADCTVVAWIDCDVLFTDPLWRSAAATSLENHDVIQLFREVVHLPAREGSGGTSADAAAPPEPPHPSFLALHRQAADPRAWLRQDLLRRLALFRAGIDPEAPVLPGPAPGFAWAARRQWLQASGGFPDTGIIGGADRVQVYTWLNADPSLMAQLRGASALCEGSSRRARQWAAGIQRHPPRVAGIQRHPPRVGCIEGRIHHLHHGDLRNRRYQDRHQLLAATGFDADRDLEIDGGGAWRFTPAAPAALRELMARYFAARREDGAPSQPLAAL